MTFESKDVLAELKTWLARLCAENPLLATSGWESHNEISILRLAIDEIERLRVQHGPSQVEGTISDNDLWPEADA